MKEKGREGEREGGREGRKEGREFVYVLIWIKFPRMQLPHKSRNWYALFCLDFTKLVIIRKKNTITYQSAFISVAFEVILQKYSYRQFHYVS